MWSDPITCVESYPEIISCSNSNGNYIRTEETVCSLFTKIFRVFYEKCRTRLSFLKFSFVMRKPKLSRRFLRMFPFFIFFISALEVLIFYGTGEKVKKILIFDTGKRRQIWRLLTYMLLHSDSIHLGLNIFLQGLLGTPLELEQGKLRCAAIYFGGGLAGSVGVTAFGAFPLMVGASGGVYALLISQIPNVILSLGTIKYATFRIVTVVVLTASDVLYISFHVYFYNNERPQIGWIAHASGAAAGLLLGFLLFSGTSDWKKLLQTASLLILVFSFLLGIIFSLAPPVFGFRFTFYD